MARGQVFRGTPADVALLQPFIAPGLPPIPGVPVGVDLKTGKVVIFDPWMLKQALVVNSTVFTVLATLNGGKSTLLKSLAIRLGSLQAGIEETEDARHIVNEARILIHDRRKALGNGVFEYERVVEFLLGESHRLFQPGLANLFDPQMFVPGTESHAFDLFEMARHIVEYTSGQAMKGLEPIALSIGIDKMVRKMPMMASPEILAAILHRLTEDDAREYFKRHESNKVLEPLQKLVEMFPKDSEAYKTEVEEVKAMMTLTRNDDYSGYRKAASHVGSQLEQLGPKTGEVFSGNGSLYNLFTDPVVSFIYEGVNEVTRGLFEIAFEVGRDKAVAYGHRELLPTIVIGDEDQKAYRSDRYTRRKLADNKEARSDVTCTITATQFYGDIANMGNSGSERRAMAAGILASTAGFFVGRQPDKPEILSDFRDMGLSKTDVYWLTKLGIGCFAFIVPGKAPIFFQHILTPSELPLIQTNQAAEQMTQRVTMSSDMYAEAAKTYGTVVAGLD